MAVSIISFYVVLVIVIHRLGLLDDNTYSSRTMDTQNLAFDATTTVTTVVTTTTVNDALVIPSRNNGSILPRARDRHRHRDL